MSILAYRLAKNPPYHLTSLNLLSNNYILSNLNKIDTSNTISKTLLSDEDIKNHVLQQTPELKIYSKYVYKRILNFQIVLKLHYIIFLEFYSGMNQYIVYMDLKIKK